MLLCTINMLINSEEYTMHLLIKLTKIIFLYISVIIVLILSGCRSGNQYKIIESGINDYPVLNDHLIDEYTKNNPVKLKQSNKFVLDKVSDSLEDEHIIDFPPNNKTILFRAMVKLFKYDDWGYIPGVPKKTKVYRIFVPGSSGYVGLKWVNYDKPALDQIFAKAGKHRSVWIIADGVIGSVGFPYCSDPKVDPYAAIKTTKIIGFYFEKSE